MNIHRLDRASLALLGLALRTGSIGKGAELAHRAVGAALQPGIHGAGRGG